MQLGAAFFSSVQKNYFNNKNYTAIYLHTFFYVLADSMMNIFSAVILYSLGMPIHFILLFFAVQFGVMGLLSPLSLVLTSRIGLVPTLCISAFFHTTAVCLLSLGSYSHFFLLFSASFFFALKGAIYHPLIYGIHSMYVENHHRGKFNSLRNIFKILATALSISILAFFLILDLKIYIPFFTISFWLLAIACYAFFLEKRPLHATYSLKEVYQYFFSKTFRENILPFSMQAFLIIEMITIPLFIYFYFKDLKITSAIIILSLFLEAMVLFFLGRYIDTFSKKYFSRSLALNALNPLIFLSSYVCPPLIYVGNMYHGISKNIFETSFSTKLQTKAKTVQDPLLFTTSKEMALCFAELFFLSILFAISLFLQEKIFVLIFLASFVATLTIYLSWKD